MALTKMNKDMAIIQALDDEPNDVGGLTAQELKEKFDEAGETIKKYLNETLTSELDTALAGTVPTTRTVNRHPLSADVIVTKSDVGLGNVENTSDADKPVSTQQKAALMLKANKTDVLEKENTTPFTPSADYHPATKKYVDDTTSDIAIGILPDKSVTSEKLADGSVTAEKMANQFYANVTHTHLPSDLITAVPISKGGTGKTTAAEALAALGGYTKAETDEKISTVQPAVGDIKTTVRTDLGEDWLLCKGEAVSAADYPELVNAMTGIENKELATKEFWSGNSSVIKINCLKYANGYWVAGGCYFSNATFYAKIAYATSLNGPWTAKDIWSNYGNVCEITCIEYANGYWVVGGSKNDQTSQIAYSTSLNGTWTDYPFSSNLGKINCIAYDDGYWVAGGTYLDQTSGNKYSGVIYYTTSITGSWTKVVVFNDSGNGYPSKINCLIHANGYWVVGGVNRYGSNAYEPIIAYATTPGGNWTTLRVSTIPSSTDGITGIGYANGYWVVCGRISSDTGQIAYATSLNGPWTIRNLDFNDIKGIAYINGEWFLCGRANIYYGTIAHSTSPGGQWLYLNLWGNPADYTGDSFVSCVEYADGLFAFGGYLKRSSSHYACMSYTTGNGVLPAISLDGAYTYIKAKEA